MSYAFGDVVLVSFPFTNQSGTKKRPAVIVSSCEYQAARCDLVIMAITSQVRLPLGFGEGLVIDWQSSGLIKPSLLKPVFATVELGLIVRSMGTLTTNDVQTLREIIAKVFG